MADRPERRKYPRIATGHVISVAPLDRRDRLAVGKNLSRGGIRFEVVGCELDLESVVRVTFNVGDHTLVAVGKVAWATDVDPITTDVGVEFIEIDPLALRLLEAEALGDAA
jgi:PilZ domain